MISPEESSLNHWLGPENVFSDSTSALARRTQTARFSAAQVVQVKMAAWFPSYLPQSSEGAVVNLDATWRGLTSKGPLWKLLS